ncbi:rhombotarget lipoprotein [Thalassotalea sp. HSM 43]|uniref:rhombotarget lipoprotein n=1 Tax=Thalassotalea sp. HSM 43 TaxID=2552945 RepID=UPI0010812AFC|nr:rhombotarget lipoprotein [Thalassotalea sp. HSM 43]QBY03481.1 rhombotarget lipoprotein [Thalassotalea sp. HSM 43]
MNMFNVTARNAFFWILTTLYLTGCNSMISDHDKRTTSSGNLMDYLYPDGQTNIVHTAAKPNIKVPVRMAIAFVPNKGNSFNNIHDSAQIDLLYKIKQAFEKHEFVESIQVLPSMYLQGDKGFEALDHVAKTYDVDLMALVSFDQLTNTDENNASLLYWTLVGMYVIPGSESSVQTLVDTAVIDIKSRKLLFRAPGTSIVDDTSTALGLDATLKENSATGFKKAVAQMNGNLEKELQLFRSRIKQGQIGTLEYAVNGQYASDQQQPDIDKTTKPVTQSAQLTSKVVSNTTTDMDSDAQSNRETELLQTQARQQLNDIQQKQKASFWQNSETNNHQQ